MKRSCVCLVFLFALLAALPISGYCQVKKDTTIILINDITIQLEATQALNDLYDFKFAQAEQQMRWFKQKYAWHPLPYFMLGLSEWWKIMPNSKETKYDDRFLAYRTVPFWWLRIYTRSTQSIKSRRPSF
jgi:hypothetical protein